MKLILSDGRKLSKFPTFHREFEQSLKITWLPRLLWIIVAVCFTHSAYLIDLTRLRDKDWLILPIYDIFRMF